MNLQEVVLSALIPRVPATKPEADKCIQLVLNSKVSSKLFEEGYRYLFETVVQNSLRQVPLDMDVFDAYLSKTKFSDEEKNEHRLLFQQLKESEVSYDKLKTILPGFVEDRSSAMFGNILINASKILTEGFDLSSGRKLKGLKDSRQYLIHRVASLQTMDAGVYPQGDIRKDLENYLAEYEASKSVPTTGALTGIREMDELTLGVQKGELWVVAAYTGEGKSTLMRNWSYNAAVNHGKNIVYASLEMSYKQVKHMFISLHSLHPKFNYPDGLKYRDIRHATLTPQEEVIQKKVVEDLASNLDYGSIYIMQLPHNETVDSLREKLLYLRTMFPVDALYVDYASLLRTDHLRQKRQTEVEEILKDLKLLALDFNDGEGLAVVTAHQISRDARKKAEKDKRYHIDFLSETSATEKTADLVCWLLRTDEMIKDREVKVGMSKYRTDKLIDDFRLFENYSCGQLKSMAAEESVVSFDS